jgi:hypothetical protein
VEVEVNMTFDVVFEHGSLLPIQGDRPVKDILQMLIRCTDSILRGLEDSVA